MKTEHDIWADEENVYTIGKFPDRNVVDTDIVSAFLVSVEVEGRELLVVRIGLDGFPALLTPKEAKRVSREVVEDADVTLATGSPQDTDDPAEAIEASAERARKVNQEELE